MQQRFARLCGAGDVDTTVVGFALHAHHVSAALRAALRHMEFFVPPRMLFVFEHLNDFWDHIAATLHRYPIADFYPQPLDLIGIVQRGAGHGSAPNAHRLQRRYRREFASAADLHQDVLHPGDARARRVFVGDGPARRPAGEAQLLLQSRAIHFHHDAVNLVGQRVALGFPLLNKLKYFVNVFGRLILRIHLEAGSRQAFERGMMVGEKCAPLAQQEVGVKIQAALGHNAGIKLAQRAGSSVARIGKFGQVLPLALLVHPLERSDGHDHFAAHFEILRQSSGLQGFFS